jgi:hypothetical protein
VTVIEGRQAVIKQSVEEETYILPHVTVTCTLMGLFTSVLLLSIDCRLEIFLLPYFQVYKSKAIGDSISHLGSCFR